MDIRPVAPDDVAAFVRALGAAFHEDVRADGPRAPDLGLVASHLAAAYLGGPSLTALAAAGGVEERRTGALEAAALAFRGAREPFCADHF